MIAAIKVIKERNQGVSDPNQHDWVSIITFDSTSGVSIVRSLTSDYDAAMQACTRCRPWPTTPVRPPRRPACWRLRTTSSPSTTAGRAGGVHQQGRRAPDRWHPQPHVVQPIRRSTRTSSAHPSDDFYGSSDTHKNAALMQCMDMQAQKWHIFPVGIGLGTDYDFMDRTARMGGTSNQDGQSPRGSGNPAEYEQRLQTIFQNIITNPKARLVQ